jgi:hypothetical protein
VRELRKMADRYRREGPGMSLAKDRKLLLIYAAELDDEADKLEAAMNADAERRRKGGLHR